MVGPEHHLRQPRPGVRVNSSGGQGRAHLRLLPQHHRPGHRPRRLRGSGGQPRDGRGARRAGQGRDDHRRRHRLPDRFRPADLPGQRFPQLGRGQHCGRPQERRASRRRVVGHAQQRYACSQQPIRGEDQLGRGREPVVRQREDLVQDTGGACDQGRPVHAVGRVRQERPPQDRLLRPLLRLGQPPVRLHGGDRDRVGDAGVHDCTGHHNTL